MGGSSGGGRLGNIKRLEAVAKEALERRRRNVFISFAHEDLNEVNLLRGQARNEQSDINFVDRSVHTPYDSSRAEYIRGRLADRINQASMTVVYLSRDTAGSDWVRWEVEKSLELGKKVIAVHSGKRSPGNVPKFIEQHGIRVVPWSRLPGELD